MKTRRQFIRIAGSGALVAGVVPVFSVSLPEKQSVPDEETAELFNIGIAGYTFFALPVEKAIEIMNKVGVSRMSMKSNYMPLNSNQEEITAVKERFKTAGINIYSLGVIYMKSREEVDQAFSYARMAGVDMIIGAPDYEFLPYAEDKVKESNIRLAIHNHATDMPIYPDATDIWNRIKYMDNRVGICIDIGHTTRYGQDPSVDIERYSKRIFDVHMKDVSKASDEGRTIEMGRGVIDIPKIVASLRKIKFNGTCSLEFEKDMRDPLAGIAESIGYFKGVCAALK